ARKLEMWVSGRIKAGTERRLGEESPFLKPIPSNLRYCKPLNRIIGSGLRLPVFQNQATHPGPFTLSTGIGIACILPLRRRIDLSPDRGRTCPAIWQMVPAKVAAPQRLVTIAAPHHFLTQ